MSNDTIIETINATVELGGKIILKDINLKINRHDTIVFIGPSGGGKTVLLKTLAGIYTPKSGHVLVGGEDWTQLESDEKHELAKKLGMLFQQGALFDTMTCLENVEFPLKEHYDMPKEEMDSIALDLLEKVNLLESKNKLPSELSGGMQRRLGIARALALNPVVIFYDDPVAGQDPMQSDQMLTLISDLKEKNNSTLVMVTSNIKVAKRMANKIYMVIEEGLIDCGDPESIENHPDARVQQFIHAETEGPIKV